VQCPSPKLLLETVLKLKSTWTRKAKLLLFSIRNFVRENNYRMWRGDASILLTCRRLLLRFSFWDGHSCGRYPSVDISEQRLLNDFIALSEYWLGADAGLLNAVSVTSGRPAYLGSWQNVVSCSERTAHRSVASVMDEDRRGADTRDPPQLGWLVRSFPSVRRRRPAVNNARFILSRLRAGPRPIIHSRPAGQPAAIDCRKTD